MIYALSTNVVADTVQSLAALRELSSDKREPVLDPDRSGILRLMIRNAFATLCLKISPVVRECDLDGETGAGSALDPVAAADGSDVIMTVEIDEPRGFGAGKAGIVRRNMEQAVAFLVLAWIMRAGGNTQQASEAESAAAVCMAAVKSELMPEIHPIRRFI